MPDENISRYERMQCIIYVILTNVSVIEILAGIVESEIYLRDVSSWYQQR